MWIAVSQFETGNFTSHLFLNHNNFFGMKFPRKRETTAAYAIPPNDFAHYNSQADSVDDLLLYLREWNYPSDFSSIDSLIEFMKSKGYFEEPLTYYLTGVQTYYA
jgi:uncharacterized FlgJ-related protein